MYTDYEFNIYIYQLYNAQNVVILWCPSVHYGQYPLSLKYWEDYAKFEWEKMYDT